MDANQQMVKLCDDKIIKKQRYNDAKLAILTEKNAILSEKNKILERLTVAVEKFISSQ